MADLTRVTSAENLLKALRSGRDDAPPVPPGQFLLPSDLGLVLPSPALASQGSLQGPLLDTPMATMVPSAGRMIPAPALPVRPMVPQPIPETPPPQPALVAQQLLGGGFESSPATPWSQDLSQNASGEPTGTGSEDTLCALPSAGTTTAAPPAPRPRRHTAQLALQRIGSITQGLLGNPSSRTAAAPVTGTPAPATPAPDDLPSDDDMSDDGYSEGMGAAGSSPLPPRPAGRAPPRLGRPLQSKPYDALIDPGLPPEEVRRMRRILSNRESARRSRKRKACQVSCLEDELVEARAVAADAEADARHAEARVAVLEADNRRLEAEVATLLRRLEERSVAAALRAVPASPTAGRAPGGRAPHLLQSPMRQLGFQTQAHRVRPAAAPLPPAAMPAGFSLAGPGLMNF